MRVRVESSPGHGGDAVPRRFFLGERAVDVVGVLDRWLSLDHSYFKVAGADGATYILRHDAASGDWMLVLFQSASRPS
jgi:hypothetical protein